jgi:hypothetical protein
MPESICGLPARLLTLNENALVAEWLSMAGDVASAYVSNRHGDDPALYHCVVIVIKPDDGPSHFVHTPCGQDVWTVFSYDQRTKVQHFQSLHAALNSIRPVLGEVGSGGMQGEPHDHTDPPTSGAHDPFLCAPLFRS